MQLEKIVNRHEEQILSIKDCLSDLTIKINRIIDNNLHIEEKLEEVLEFIKSSRDFHHRLNHLDTKIIGIMEKTDKLFEITSIHKDDIKDLKSKQFSNFINILNKYWSIILFLLIGVGWAIDFFYKIKR